MNDTEFLNQTEHISDIFTKIMLKIMTTDVAGSASDEITMAQFHALKHVAQHGSCTIGSLAEGLSVSQPAATMLVDRMSRRDFVARQPGQSDRRQAEVSLTPRGKNLLRRIESERVDRLGRVLRLMGRSEREQFVESLERFVAAALKLERSPDEVCLRCGTEHMDDCIVNQAHLALAGEQVERT